MAEINKIIKNARDVLVGKVPDPQSQIDQITLALIYKFMDAKDQEAVSLGLKKSFFTETFEDYSFTKIMQAPSNEKQYELYNKGIELLQYRQDLPQTFTSVFKDAFIPYRDALTLHLFLIEINKIPTDNTELLGTAFEDLLSIMGSQGDAGQFRTPRHIIDMIVEIVEPKKGEKILDPACGTAGFLISAYNKVTEQELTVAEKEDLINNGLVGYDINPNMVKLSNVNLFLHGCQKPNIHLYDTLTEKDFWSDRYDVILANPPFMTPKGGIRPHELFTAINANRSEVLFTYYITQHLTRNGRAGFIVPEGVVFQTANAYKEMRRILVDEDYLYAVISLPNGVFNPYSGVKTSILLLDKALAKKTDKILFVKMNSDGLDLGAQRRPIDKNDIPNIIETVKSFAFNIETETENDFVDKYCLSIVVNKEQIRQNDYVLVGERYKKTEKTNSKWDYVSLGNQELFQIESGGTPNSNTPEYWNGDINWVTLVDLPAEDNITVITNTERKISEDGLRNSSARLLPVNSVLISSRATIGRVAINKVPLATNQGFKNIIIKDFSRVDPMFVALIMKYQKDALEKLSAGGTFKEFSKSSLMSFEIPLPPIKKQQEIVAEIEQYQKIIDGATLVIDNYFNSFNIKNEWTKKPLNEVCDVRDGTHDSPKFVSEGIPLITSKNIINGEIDFSNVSYITEEDCKLIEKRSKVDFGDILMPMIGTIGRPLIVNTNKRFAIKNVALIKCKENPINKYVLSVLKSKLFNEYIESHKRGGTQNFISLSDIRNFEIPLPPLEEQQDIIREIEKEEQIIAGNKELIKIYKQKINNVLSAIWEGQDTI